MPWSCQLKSSCYNSFASPFSSLPGESLHVPDLTKQRRKFVVVHLPGCEHLRVVVAERPQLRQTTQETSKVLWILWMVQHAHLPQHLQYGLLESLNSILILHVGTICVEGQWHYISGIIKKKKKKTVNVSSLQPLTWCQNGDRGKESLFLLYHVELPNTFVEVEHGGDEFLWNTCSKKYFKP